MEKNGLIMISNHFLFKKKKKKYKYKHLCATILIAIVNKNNIIVLNLVFIINGLSNL